MNTKVTLYIKSSLTPHQGPAQVLRSKVDLPLVEYQHISIDSYLTTDKQLLRIYNVNSSIG